LQSSKGDIWISGDIHQRVHRPNSQVLDSLLPGARTHVISGSIEYYLITFDQTFGISIRIFKKIDSNTLGYLKDSHAQEGRAHVLHD